MFPTKLFELKLEIVDYVIIGVGISLSVAIGFFYSLKQKQDNTFEYFLGSRTLSSIPIILSYFATYISSSVIVASPNEIYLFGTQTMLAKIMILPCIWFTNTFITPVFHQMNCSSIYKFFEERYNRGVSYTVLIVGVLQLLFGGSTMVYITAVSFSQVTFMSTWAIVAIMSGLCILYSIFGGMRGIIFADNIQAILILLAVLALFIQSIVMCDSLSTVWRRNWDTGRLELFNFDFDPRVRYTFWGSTIGGFFSSLVSGAVAQPLQQRAMAASTLSKAKGVIQWGMITFVIISVMIQLTGLFSYSYFHGCDPYKSGAVRSVNQIFIIYIMHIFQNVPGLMGLFCAGFISSLLSTYSSILNSISAILVDGLISKYLPNASERTITYIAKFIVVICGLLTIAGVYLAEMFPTVIQATATFLTLPGGAFLALFLIGILFPQANTIIAFTSYLLTCVFMSWLAVGAMLQKHSFVAKPLIIDQCQLFTNETIISSNGIPMANFTTAPSSTKLSSIEKYFPLSSVSFAWYALFGFMFSLFLFILLSLLFQIFFRKSSNCRSTRVDLIPKIIQKFHLKLNRKWRRVLLCDIYIDQFETELETKRDEIKEDSTFLKAKDNSDNNYIEQDIML